MIGSSVRILARRRIMRCTLCCFTLLTSAVAPSSLAAQTVNELRAKASGVLAQLDGKIPRGELKQPVEILRDRWGIPHIYAHNSDDLFFAQGWVAAQDRLFQIDLWRRVGNGETAEILGPEAIEADKFARLIRYRGDMDAEWKSYSPDTKQIAVAFTRGINAYIDHSGDKLPIEFQILGYRPGKWQPQDILSRMSGIIMSRNFAQEIARARVVSAVGVERARQLAPSDPPIDYAPAPELDLKDITKDILKGYQAAAKAIQFFPAAKPASAVGAAAFFETAPCASNNWVIDGTLSASGKPMLASDPHRTIAMPSLRYLVHLQAPGWNVIGGGEPALPGIALGHNERIAWGITIVGTDQSDLFVEATNPANPEEHKVGQRWEPMKVVRETVRVKGKPDVELELRFTRHGPVLFQDDKVHRAYALKWAGSEPGGAAYLAGLAVGRAGNKQEFLEALKAWKIPSLNFAYADKDDTIGWVAAALTPVRKGHDGLLPVPGNGGFEWQRYLDVAELPQRFNPKEGWLATANHNILPKGYKHAISYEWAPQYRFQRVKANLEAKAQFDLKDFQRIQHDTVSLPGQALQRLLKRVPMREAALQPYAEMFLKWDANLSRDTTAGPLYALWLDELQDSVFRMHVPKRLVPALRSLSDVSVLLAALES